MQALGFIETKGFVAATEAADSALKAANVSLVGQKRVGSGLVTVIITGDVAAVKAAIEAGAESAAAIGEVLSAQVIASPHEDLAAIIENEPAKVGTPARSRGRSAQGKSADAAGDKNPGV